MFLIQIVKRFFARVVRWKKGLCFISMFFFLRNFSFVAPIRAELPSSFSRQPILGNALQKNGELPETKPFLKATVIPVDRTGGGWLVLQIGRDLEPFITVSILPHSESEQIDESVDLLGFWSGNNLSTEVKKLYCAHFL